MPPACRLRRRSTHPGGPARASHNPSNACLAVSLIALLAAPVNAGMSPAATPPTADWTRQFGTAAYDVATGVAATASGVTYTVGYTEGAFAGQASQGGTDAFVRKTGAGGKAR
jgi:cytochrome b